MHNATVHTVRRCTTVPVAVMKAKELPIDMNASSGSLLSSSGQRLQLTDSIELPFQLRGLRDPANEINESRIEVGNVHEALVVEGLRKVFWSVDKTGNTDAALVDCSFAPSEKQGLLLREMTISFQNSVSVCKFTFLGQN